MSRDKLCALASFRLAAHDLEVETLKWRRVHDQATGRLVNASVPRERCVCGLCCDGLKDELHMVAECPCHAAVRQLHQVYVCCCSQTRFFVHYCGNSSRNQQRRCDESPHPAQ